MIYIQKESQGKLFYKQFIKELRDSFFITINNKKIIPQPNELEKNISEVFEKYSDSKYGIITERVIKQHNDNMIHVKKGCISDVLNKPSELLIQGIIDFINYCIIYFLYLKYFFF